MRTSFATPAAAWQDAPGEVRLSRVRADGGNDMVRPPRDTAQAAAALQAQAERYPWMIMWLPWERHFIAFDCSASGLPPVERATIGALNDALDQAEIEYLIERFTTATFSRTEVARKRAGTVLLPTAAPTRPRPAAPDDSFELGAPALVRPYLQPKRTGYVTS